MCERKCGPQVDHISPLLLQPLVRHFLDINTDTLYYGQHKPFNYCPEFPNWSVDECLTSSAAKVR